MRFRAVVLLLGVVFVLPGGCRKSSCTPCEGDFQIETRAGLLYAAQCGSVGSLRIYQQTWVEDVNLPCLESVDEDLLIGFNDALRTLDIPRLTTVGADLWSTNNASLTTLDMPALTTVGGDLNIRDNAVLTSAGMPDLTTVGSTLHIRDNAALTTLDVRRLASVDCLSIGSNAALTTLDVRRLTSVGDLGIMHNAALTTLDMPRLTSVGDLDIRGNNALTSLGDLWTLGKMESLSITDNACLEEATVALFVLTQGVRGDIEQHGNGTNYPCP